MNDHSLSDFYASCDMTHRELFSIIIHEWQETGLKWSYSDGDIALGSYSVIMNQQLNFFFLHPGEGIYPACVILDTDIWREHFGQEETDAFLRKLKSIHALTHKQRANRFYVDDPGHLSGPVQQQLRDCIKGFAYRISDLTAS